MIPIKKKHSKMKKRIKKYIKKNLGLFILILMLILSIRIQSVNIHANYKTGNSYQLDIRCYKTK